MILVSLILMIGGLLLGFLLYLIADVSAGTWHVNSVLTNEHIKMRRPRLCRVAKLCVQLSLLGSVLLMGTLTIRFMQWVFG